LDLATGSLYWDVVPFLVAVYGVLGDDRTSLNADVRLASMKLVTACKLQAVTAVSCVLHATAG